MYNLRKEYLAAARRLLELGKQLGGTPQTVSRAGAHLQRL